MSDDVRIATALRNHRKTKRLRRLLGGDGCWALVCLFLFAGEQRWTGDLGGMTDEDIEDEAGWDGAPGALVSALLQVGFLVGEESARAIHDWQEHNPYAASKGVRIEKGKRAAAARWDKDKDAKSVPPAPYKDATGIENDAQSIESVATGTAKQCPPAPAPAPAPTPSPSPSASEASALPPAVLAWKAIRDAAGYGPNQAHTANDPRLIAAVDAGVTAELFADVATEAARLNPPKPFGWVVATALGRHRDAAKPPGASHANPVRLSAAERVRAHAIDGELADQRAGFGADGHANLVGSDG